MSCLVVSDILVRVPLALQAVGAIRRSVERGAVVEVPGSRWAVDFSVPREIRSVVQWGKL